MNVTIAIPTPLRAYTEQSKKIQVEAETISASLESLVTKYPKLRKHLFEGDELRNFVNIYHNDEDIRYTDDKLGAAVSDGDTIAIIPSIAGGSL